MLAKNRPAPQADGTVEDQVVLTVPAVAEEPISDWEDKPFKIGFSVPVLVVELAGHAEITTSEATAVEAAMQPTEFVAANPIPAIAALGLLLLLEDKLLNAVATIKVNSAL